MSKSFRKTKIFQLKRGAWVFSFIRAISSSVLILLLLGLSPYPGQFLPGSLSPSAKTSLTVTERDSLLAAEREISKFLTDQYEAGAIAKEIFDDAMARTYPSLKLWTESEDIFRLSPGIRRANLEAIRQGRWTEIVEAYRQEIAFGTAGIRGKAALTREELLVLKEDGPSAAILKGPNTINDIVLLQKTAGLIKYAKENGKKKVVIGYDSRIAGAQFADLVARLFIAQSTQEHPFQLFLFDEVSPFPELTFGITVKEVEADLGILISASHNPADYNGYKITRENGAQLNQEAKDKVLDAVSRVDLSEIVLVDSIADAQEGQLIWLGGDSDLEKKDYYGFPRIDMHTLHVEQVKKFILDKELVEQHGSGVKIGFAAFNGAGYKAVPRLLKETGFTDFKVVSKLQELDGLFPVFQSGEQPDPGDPIAADIAVSKFIAEHGQEAFEELDILFGTDPDADRMGIVVKIPQDQQGALGKYQLLSANDAWTLLLWYRLMKKKELGQLEDPQNHVVTMSHVTTDAIEAVAARYGVRSVGEMMDKTGTKERGGYLQGRRTWVGFTYLAEEFEKAAKAGLIAEMGAEESNGMSIGGHVNDKDGTLAVILLAEVAAYAKRNGTTLLELLDQIYKEIGHYATANKPLPRVGSFEGAAGVSEKITILRKAQEWMNEANAGANTSDPLMIAGQKVIGAVEFKSGRIDDKHYEGVPDEGIRFFFEDEGLGEGQPFTGSKNYLTIRPSGTSQTLRFYTQEYSTLEGEGEAIAEKKLDHYLKAERISLLAQRQILEATGLAKYIPAVEEQLDKLKSSVGVEPTITWRILPNHEAIAEITAKKIGSILSRKKDARLLMPFSETPIPVYRRLVEMAEGDEIDLSQVTILMLDENWGQTTARDYIHQHLIEPLKLLGIDIEQQVHFFNGQAEDPDAEVARYQRLVDEGEIDFALLGIGPNGHIAYNEPGSDLTSRARLVKLEGSDRYGITVGVADILRAREIFLIANGTHKAGIIKRLHEEEPNAGLPATWLKKHPNTTILIDEETSLEIVAKLKEEFHAGPGRRGRFEELFKDEGKERGGWVGRPWEVLNSDLPEQIEEAAKNLREDGVEAIGFVAMGGESSIIGPSTQNTLNISNTSPKKIHRLIGNRNLRLFRWFVVSKSGGTKETRSNAGYLEELYRAEGLDPTLYITYVTDPETALEKEKVGQGFTVEHREWNDETTVGGRNTLVNNPTLLAYAWRHPGKLRAMLDALTQAHLPQQPKDSWISAAVEAVPLIGQGRHRVVVVLPEEMRKKQSVWLQQNPEESEGKNNSGFTVYTTPPDLETLRNRKDQGWVFIELRVAGQEAETQPYMEQAGKNGHPVITIPVESQDPDFLPQIISYGWMKFVAVSGALLKINFSDQPPVEEYKKYMKDELPTIHDAETQADGAVLNNTSIRLLYDGLLSYLNPAQKAEIEQMKKEKVSPSALFAKLLQFTQKKLPSLTLAYYGDADPETETALDRVTQGILHKELGYAAKWGEGTGVLHGLFVNWYSGYLHQIPVHLVSFNHEQPGPPHFFEGPKILNGGAVAAHWALKGAKRPSLILVFEAPMDRKSIETFFVEVRSHLAKEQSSGPIQKAPDLSEESL